MLRTGPTKKKKLTSHGWTLGTGFESQYVVRFFCFVCVFFDKIILILKGRSEPNIVYSCHPLSSMAVRNHQALVVKTF